MQDQDIFDEAPARSGGGGVAKFMLFLFVVLIAAGTWAAYNYGGDASISINGRDFNELQPWEVVGGVIIGIFGLIIGLLGGAVGILIGLLATVLALALAFMGIFFGLFITAGVVLGPFLLVAMLFLLMRRGGGRQRQEQIADAEII